MARKVLYHSKLGNRTVNKLIECFVVELPAVRAAQLAKVNRHTAARVYEIIRQNLARECERESLLPGEVEVDESYFGGRRKGNRGRGAAGKVIVFGLLKRGGRVYTRPVKNVTRATLRLIIKSKVPEGSTIYSDSFSSYDGLITDGYKHYRINHQVEFARGKRNHINGIESFWSYAKAKMRKHYGIPRNKFHLYLKEMEYRYNHRNRDLAKKIRALLAKHRA